MSSEGSLEVLRPWSEQEDLAGVITRLLEARPDGRADLAECLATAQRIDASDDESWYCEWMACADGMKSAASDAATTGDFQLAFRKWSRAVDCYEAAACPFSSSRSHQSAALARMRECARDFLRSTDPQGEVVTIPWRADYPLEAYFLPARGEAGRAPTVICIGEPGRRKETSLFKLAYHAEQRGLALLVVDLLGSGLECRFDEIVGRPDLESAIASVTDYVTSRDDVDDSRIAILADDWSSSFVARGIALDPRYAAAVCDAGLWDIHERVFLSRRLAGSARGRMPIASDGLAARQITCPLLVTVPERGWLRADIATRLVAQIRREHPDITLKIVSGEGAAALEADAFVFDWLARRLVARPRVVG
ncbi:alpha/beta hydrolase family protein [Bradyrhizobium sp. HKCCYLR20261]|uniref:alpha/beta hydrolase family protein n=1 Tax=unclassified Bradyrhizobium TaxID=2631580 RepID=UPI003EC0F571